MKKFTFFPAVLLLALSLLSCSGTKSPTQRQIGVLIPITEADKSATKNGVTVEVKSIDLTNVSSYPDLSAHFPVYTKGLLQSQPSLQQTSTLNVLADFSDPPAVTLMTKITNNTGHIIKLNGSDIGISIGGQDWKKLDAAKISSAWLNYFRANFQYQQTVPVELFSAIQNISIWNDDEKILPGKSITLYTPFDVKIGTGTGTATLSIYDLVTDTDAAGNPTERTSFDFNFKVSPITIKTND